MRHFHLALFVEHSKMHGKIPLAVKIKEELGLRLVLGFLGVRDENLLEVYIHRSKLFLENLFKCVPDVRFQPLSKEI